jgi:hypothetical protein
MLVHQNIDFPGSFFGARALKFGTTLFGIGFIVLNIFLEFGSRNISGTSVCDAGMGRTRGCSA